MLYVYAGGGGAIIFLLKGVGGSEKTPEMIKGGLLKNERKKNKQIITAHPLDKL